MSAKKVDDVASVRARGEVINWRSAPRFQSRPEPEPGPESSRGPAPANPPDELLPTVGEDAMAAEFTRRHGADWRYVAAWGRWMRWNGSTWRHEQTLEVYDLARAVCRSFAAAEPGKLASVIASAQKRSAVVTLAQADRQHAATIEQWDADSWLLGTPGGTVDLRTGVLREARREDYITRSTAVTPLAMPTPMWDALLARALEGDRDMIAYLQRVAGYVLTGETREHALLFLYGTGANSKSTILNALSRLMGEYAVNAPMETFVVTSSDRHPTDLAMLRGARLVTAQETESGRRWAESKLKSLTGGDPISARFMRGDFFTYTPQFKLVLSGNHRPELRDVDEAIRRRFHLVPFRVTVPPAERDPELPEKLRAEGPGILAWAIRGCLEWQAGGLRPPQRVRAATDAYLDAEDRIARWLEECCHVGRQHEDTAANLFGSWKAWCEAGEEHKLTAKKFAQKLEARGFRSAWVQRVRGYCGLAVRR